MNNLLTLLGNLFVFFARLVSDYRRDKEKHDAENRIAAVRADPASGLICLPPDEAGALLLWMEYAESNGSL